MRVEWKWQVVGLIIGIILALLLTGDLWAQSTSTQVINQSINLKSEKTSGLKDYGSLQLAVFTGSDVAAGLSVQIDSGEIYQTTLDGMLFLHLAEGTHTATLNPGSESDKKEFQFNVSAGETTQALITLLKESKNYELELQNPELKKKLTSSEENAELTEFSGKVIDSTNGKAVSGARLFVRGASYEAKTDENGKFSLTLPVGKHDISIIHRKFATQTLRTLEVTKNSKEKGQTQTISLNPTGLELEEFVVLAPHVEGSLGALIEIRKKTSSVADVLGAEQIAKAGDSDAASSLKRVTGLTLVDGKYIYVRGLGERYSQTLLDGSTLPSPDPARRVVPLDMFPSGIIKNLVIQKSYTADKPGEFGGGAILLETKSIPEKFFFKIKTSYSYSPGDTFKDRLTSAGGSHDWNGIDDGSRDLPSGLAQAISGNQRLAECNLILTSNCFTTEELTEFSKEMKKNYRVESKKVNALPGLSVSVGDKIQIGALSFGAMGSGRYSDSWESKNKIKRSYNLGNSSTGELILNKDQEKLTSEREIDMGGTLDLGVQYKKNHTLSVSGLLIRKTTDETEISTGTDTDQTNLTFQDTKLKWTERKLNSYSVKGEHIFDMIADTQLNWRYSRSQATLHEPDQRQYRYYDDGSGYRFETRGDGNRRIYSELEDNNSDIGIDLKVPYKWFGHEGAIKLGYNGIDKERSSQIRRFKFEEQVAGSLDPSILRQGPEDIFADQNLGKQGFLLKEDTQPTDNYNATQTISAGYAMMEIPVFSWLKVISGMRYEKSLQDVRTYKLFDPDNAPDVASLETIDYLPAHSATIFLTPKMQVRAAYSETLSRPDFKELSTAPYHDVENDRIVVGNNELVGSVISNIDLRWEWYFKSSENISLGIFHKKFKTPIEAVARNSTEGGITFKNAKEAKNLGAEFEFRKRLDFVSKSLSNFSVAGNYSYIKSEVTIAPEDAGLLTSTTRALQGQSPYVINAQLLYENEDAGTDLSLLYNIFGERITEVGVLGMPDVYERPFAQLDFVAAQKIASNYAVSFKVSNLIDPEARQTQGGEIVQLYRKGRSFSLGLSGNF